jgi:integrase
MAYYRKRAAGWRAEVEKAGVRDSATFPTKAQAVAWAAKRETEILAGKWGELPRRFVSEALTKYAEEVSPKRKGFRWEKVRLEKFGRELKFRDRIISEVTQTDIAAWRDARLKEVKPSSVNREWNLLLGVFQIARKEWRWLDHLPFEDVKRPRDPKPRNRRVSENEVAEMCAALGYSETASITMKQHEIAVAFMLAIETGMRAGELCSLHWTDIGERTAHLSKTKNYDERHVPLSKRAVELIERLRGRDETSLFTFTSATMDALFRKARIKAAKKLPGISTLHFHDSRHEACTRLSKKLSVLELARVIGHRDLKSLLIYYNPTPEELAAKLD